MTEKPGFKFFLIVSIALIFTACFSPWKDDKGTIIVSIGGGNSRAVDDDGYEVLPWKPEIKIKNLLHVITITGPDQESQTRKCKGAQKVSFTVSPGIWNIEVKAYEISDLVSDYPEIEEIPISEDNPVAVNEPVPPIAVKAGRNNPINITMKPPDADTFNVTLVLDGGSYDGNNANPNGEYIISVSIGSSHVLQVPVKPGWDFGGWYKNLDDENTRWNEEYISEAITLYAKWIPETYTLTIGVITGQDGTWNKDTVYGTVEILAEGLSGVEGEDGSITMSNIPEDASVTIKANPNKDYNFEKWVTTNNINENPYQIEPNKDAGSELLNIPIGNLPCIEKTITLYAVFNGNGTDTPKNITTVEELAEIGNDSLSGYYALMSDLDFDKELSSDEPWTPVGSHNNQFQGTFDGRGHTIDLGENKVGIVSSGDPYAGLFGVIGEGGIVKNLKLTGSITVDGSFSEIYVGAIAGYNNGTIENVASEVSISITTSENKIVGGIVGNNFNDGTIQNCYSTGAVTVNSTSDTGFVGGIAGSNSGSIFYCWTGGQIQGYKCAGGIAGYNNDSALLCKIESCVALNESVSVIDRGQGIASRVVGRGVNATLSNNYANKDMTVNNMTVTTGDSDNNNGADFTNSGQSSWTSTDGPEWTINNSGASESSPWVWDNSTNRPKLWFE